MVTISSLLVALIRIMCTALPSTSAKLVLDGKIMNLQFPDLMCSSRKYLNFSCKPPPPPQPLWKFQPLCGGSTCIWIFSGAAKYTACW